MKKKQRTGTGGKRNRLKMRILAGMTVCMLAAAGCGSGTARQGADVKESGGFRLSESARELTDSRWEQQNYGETAVTDAFRESYGEFALKLLTEGRREAGENPMVSPLSVMTALEMTRNGARGETEKQMRELLYGEGQAEAGEELVACLTGLPSKETARFHFANSVWFQDEGSAIKVDEDFLKSSAEAYGARIFAAPFDESTRKDINGWVEWETEGMLPELLKEIPEDAVMYLINALAFDAQWEKIYTSDQIHDAEFFPEGGDPQTVKMMYSTESYLIGDERARGFLKPYAGEYAFAALMPEEGIGIDTYLAGLTGEELMRILSQPQETIVEAGLPGFSARTQLMMKPMLEKLGMSLAFDPNQADFSGIGQSSEGNIYIGQVIASTFIQVDEQGTRAGAATAVEAEAGGALSPEQVILNRPFLYAVIDTERKLPIFLGIMESAGEK